MLRRRELAHIPSELAKKAGFPACALLLTEHRL